MTRGGLTRMIGKLLAAIVCLTIAGVAVGYFFGVPILSWFYGIDLSSCRAELLILVLGGGCDAVVTLMFYGITVLRKQKLLVVGYGATLVLALVISNILVSSYGLMGASVAFLISMARGLRAAVLYHFYRLLLKRNRAKWILLGAPAR